MKTHILRNYLSVLTLLSLAAAPFVSAEGGGSAVGGGGDTRAQEFYTVASKISILMVKITQDTVDRTNPMISVGLTRELVRDYLRVVPGDGCCLRGRNAYSEVGNQTTYLDVDHWEKLNLHERYRLVAHELMVLTGTEGDGEYGVSEDLIQVILNSRHGFILKADRFEEMADGAVTFWTPRTRDGSAIAWSSDNNGVCKYLGFSRSLSAEIGYRDNMLLNKIDKNGHIKDRYRGTAVHFVLVCI